MCEAYLCSCICCCSSCWMPCLQMCWACMLVHPAISLYSVTIGTWPWVSMLQATTMTHHHSLTAGCTLQGWTALHIAAKSHPKCVRALLCYAPPTYLWTVDRPLGSEETQCASEPATKKRHTCWIWHAKVSVLCFRVYSHSQALNTRSKPFNLPIGAFFA